MEAELNIEQLAHLAHLAVDNEQALALKQELTAIFNMIDTLVKHDTSGIDPLAHPLNQTQPLRQDTVSETNQRSQLQQGAPATDDGLYLVPQFITTE